MAKPLLHLVSSPAHPRVAPKIEIVTTVPKHLRELVKTLRAEDAAEIIAFGLSAERALWQSWKNARIRKTALIDGQVAACFGVCGMFMGDVGQPWLLTSNHVYKVSSLRFARIYKQEAEEMLKLFPRLENYCHSEYAGAIRLLGITGFEVGEIEMIKGVSVCKFWRGA